MTLSERSTLYATPDYQHNVKTCMLDKITYWSSTIPAIGRTEEQEKQVLFSRFALGNQDTYAAKVAGIAIAQSCIAEAVEATDANIAQAVNLALSGNLEFLI